VDHAIYIFERIERFTPSPIPGVEATAMRAVNLLALVLVVVGALNWGLVGLAQFDLVAALFGGQSAPLSRVVYSLVGVAGLVLAATQLALAPAPRPALAGVR
jgi:uncharacterized membrane protein YuzA (DUF378 family)